MASASETVEPAAQPVVAHVVHHVEEGRRGDGEGHGLVFQGRRGAGIAGEEVGVPRGLGQVPQGLGIQAGEELSRLFQDEGVGVTVGRDLVPLFVDLTLLAGADGLVGRQGVDGEEARAVAREAVGGHHADPGIHGIQLAAGGAVEAPAPQAADLGLGVGMEEHAEVQVIRATRSRDVGQAPSHVGGLRRGEPGFRQHPRQGVQVIGGHAAPHEGRLQGGGAPAAEGVVDPLAGQGQALDEVAGAAAACSRPGRRSRGGSRPAAGGRSRTRRIAGAAARRRSRPRPRPPPPPGRGRPGRPCSRLSPYPSRLPFSEHPG